MRQRRAFFFAILMVLPLAFLELFCQGLYYWKYGRPPWQSTAQEQFNVRPFSQFVNDQRFMTMKPDTVVDYGSWSVVTDTNGFRITEGGPPNDLRHAAVVFLGDSVPFGFGLPAESSLPSLLAGRLLNDGETRPVINAAIPSYSLHQAVARYEREIAGNIEAKTLVVWSYDPVTQLSLLGKDWQPDVNWTTQSRTLSDVYGAGLDAPSYSAALSIARKFTLRLVEGTTLLERFDPDDASTASRFQFEVDRALERLLNLAGESGLRRLVLLPLTAPASSRAGYSPSRQAAMRLYNDTLAAFAQRHAEVTFLDLVPLLDAQPESAVFLDKCCHLTARGNAIAAEAIGKILSARPDAEPASK